MIQDNYIEVAIFFSLCQSVYTEKNSLSAAAFGIRIDIMYSTSFKKPRDPGFESRTVEPHLYFLTWNC